MDSLANQRRSNGVAPQMDSRRASRWVPVVASMLALALAACTSGSQAANVASTPPAASAPVANPTASTVPSPSAGAGGSGSVGGHTLHLSAQSIQFSTNHLQRASRPGLRHHVRERQFRHLPQRRDPRREQRLDLQSGILPAWKRRLSGASTQGRDLQLHLRRSPNSHDWDAHRRIARHPAVPMGRRNNAGSGTGHRDGRQTPRGHTCAIVLVRPGAGPCKTPQRSQS